jgi:uncharacterized protein YbjT (DUF2867 family)
MNNTVLVLGATGRQGGATARHLLTKGWRVRTLIRDPNKPAAQALHQAGAEVVQGDYDDQASLAAAMQDVYGVFSVQASVDEVRQGKNIANAAREASIQHFIYSSMQSAEEIAHVGGDASKWELEQYIQALGLPATILRPCFFMETLIAPRSDVPGGTSSDTFAIAIKPDVTMGLIAVDDIGAFAAIAFEHPEQYLSKTIEIAGDILTPLQIVAAIKRVTGSALPYFQIPMETLRQQNMEIARAVDFLNSTGYTADITMLHKMYPGLMDFDTWLKREDQAIL